MFVIALPPSAAMGVIVILVILVALALLPPALTVTIRRLHDIGLSGFFVLLHLVPYIGSLALFVMSLIPSQKYPNRYGPYYKDVLEGRASVRP
jgi:uncharacterized membrane protein YhaH (DUF805 family)